MSLIDLSDDIFRVVGESFDSATIVRCTRVNHEINRRRFSFIEGRLIYHYKTIFRTTCIPTHLWKMDCVDLARTEAWIFMPHGSCVCCLRDIPIKLGGRCIECVGAEESAFVPNRQPLLNLYIKCRSSHKNMVFSCFFCQASSCLMCLMADDACAMCRVI